MKIMCIGDSLTNGEIGYTYRNYLNDRYKTINKGIDGDTTLGCYNRLKGYLNDERYNSIKTYILFIGINDILFTFPEDNYKHIKENFSKLYEKMLISLKNKNNDVILISLPYTELLNLNESIILSMNKIIENLKEKYMCKYIDIYSIQKEEKLKGYTLTLDGVHFNELSSKLLGKCVNEILSK